MNWDAFLQSLADSSIGTSILQDGTTFPWLESTHVVALALVFGSIIMVDLRLIGVGSYRKNAAALIRDLLPYTWVAFALAVVTGSLMFVSNAPMYWQSTPFKIKMVLIALAGLNMVIFHLGAHRRIAEWGEAAAPPSGARMAGFLSIALWTAVLFVGRWIGFSAPFA